MTGRPSAESQGAKLGSERNVEVVKAVFAAHGRGDMAAVFDLYDQEIQWQTLSIAPGQSLYQGHDGVRSFMRSWLGAWREWHVDVEEVSSLGAEQVLTVFRQYGFMRDSEHKIEQRVAQVWTVRDGKVVGVHDYLSRAEALEAAAAAT